MEINDSRKCSECGQLGTHTLNCSKREAVPSPLQDLATSSPSLSAPPAKSEATTNYATSFGKYGGYLGLSVMFAFPRAGGMLMWFIVGAVCGGGGVALGNAVGLFFDSVGEKNTDFGVLPEKTSMAAASLILGIIGLVAWFIPLAGLPVTITGFILGRKARLSPQRGLALSGMGLSLIGLLLSNVNGYFGAMTMVQAGMQSHGY